MLEDVRRLPRACAVCCREMYMAVRGAIQLACRLLGLSNEDSAWLARALHDSETDHYGFESSASASPGCASARSGPLAGWQGVRTVSRSV